MINQNRRQFVANANAQINATVRAYRERKDAARRAAFAQSYRDAMIAKGLIRPAGDAKIVAVEVK